MVLEPEQVKLKQEDYNSSETESEADKANFSSDDEYVDEVSVVPSTSSPIMINVTQKEDVLQIKDTQISPIKVELVQDQQKMQALQSTEIASTDTSHVGVHSLGASNSIPHENQVETNSIIPEITNVENSKAVQHENYHDKVAPPASVIDVDCLEPGDEYGEEMSGDEMNPSEPQYDISIFHTGSYIVTERELSQCVFIKHFF